MHAKSNYRNYIFHLSQYICWRPIARCRTRWCLLHLLRHAHSLLHFCHSCDLHSSRGGALLVSCTRVVASALLRRTSYMQFHYVIHVAISQCHTCGSFLTSSNAFSSWTRNEISRVTLRSCWRFRGFAGSYLSAFCLAWFCNKNMYQQALFLCIYKLNMTNNGKYRIH